MVVFIDLLGFGILIPIIPSFAYKYLHASEADIGIVIAVYSLVQFVFNPIFGTLSDRYGRRNIILFTLFMNAVGYVMFSLTNSFFMLMMARIVSGVGGSSIGVAQAYIADVTTPQERARVMGLIGVAFGLGFVFGPMLGGVFSHFGYAVTGYAAAGFSFLALIVSFFYLPESMTKEKHHTEAIRLIKLFNFDSFASVFKSKSAFFVISMTFFVTFSIANIYGTLALLGTTVFDFTDFDIGMLYGVMGIVSAFMQGFMLNKLTKRYTQLQLLVVGFLSLAGGLALIPFGENMLIMGLVLALMSIGTGSLNPVLLSLISQVTAENEQGKVLGTNQSLSSLARVLGPLWGGFAFEYFGYHVPFLTGAAVSLLLTFYCMRFYNPIIQKRLIDVQGQQH